MTRAEALARANALLTRSPVIDGHNDLAISMRAALGANPDVAAYDLRAPTQGQTDLARLRAGHVGGQLWSVFIAGDAQDGFARSQLEQIALARRIVAAYPEALALALGADDVEREMRAGRVAGLLAMEGGYGLEGSLGALRAYYDLGVRSLGLTHNQNLAWADAQGQPPEHDGLTPFGEDVVREANRLGMLVDLAHAADATALDALRVSRAPVIFSHIAARALCDIPRNVSDEVLRALRANGGTVMVTFPGAFVSQEVADAVAPALAAYRERAAAAETPAERAALRGEIFGALELPRVTVARVADHVEHVRDVAGVDHVGVGSDFDGAFGWPEGLSDVSMFPNLFAELVQRGWSDADLARLASENFLRVLRAAERVAAEIAAEPLAAPATTPSPPTPARDRSR